MEMILQEGRKKTLSLQSDEPDAGKDYTTLLLFGSKVT